jgi:hypothetical protein
MPVSLWLATKALEGAAPCPPHDRPVAIERAPMKMGAGSSIFTWADRLLGREADGRKGPGIRAKSKKTPRTFANSAERAGFEPAAGF